MQRFDPNLLIRIPQGFKGIKVPVPTPKPPSLPPALGGALAGLGFAIGLAISRRLTGGGNIVGEEQERAAIKAADRKRQEEAIRQNNSRDRRRSENIQYDLPFQGGQGSNVGYWLVIRSRTRRWIVNRDDIRVEIVSVSGFEETTLFPGFGGRLRSVVFDPKNEPDYRGKIIVTTRPEGGADNVINYDFGDKISEPIDYSIVRVQRQDGTSPAADIAQYGNPPATIPIPPTTKTRTPVLIPEVDVEQEPARRYSPRPYYPNIGTGEPEVVEGQRWFADGTSEIFVRRTDPKTGRSTEIVTARRPNPNNPAVRPERPVIPEERPDPEPPIKVPPVVPPLPEPEPPKIIPVPVPIPFPSTPEPIPTPKPFVNPPPLEFRPLQPVERAVIPMAREPERTIALVPTLETRLTFPLPSVPTENCDPCIIAIRDKLNEPECERDDLEEISILLVEIEEPPTNTKATWNTSQQDAVFMAGYFCFTRDGYDLVPEIPVRRLQSAHIFPRGATGYKLYPNNGAVLSATVQVIQLPRDVVLIAPCKL